MKSFAALAMVGAVMALPQPQAVTSAIAPSESTPSGCSTSFDGQFEISVVNVTSASKRSLEARQSKALTLTLKDGILTDDLNRIGYIASNQQFQFDGPVQAGAIYTAGWSVCSNNTLALGDPAIFYQCLSGTFYNLYDESTGAQCNAIYLDVIALDSSASATATVASQIADGQVTGTPVSQISDGQIQATTGVVVSQISDGQIQASTAPATTSRAVVSQISDGQIQATTGASRAVVSQISDGQIQATTGVASSSRAVVSQISDGQIQATAGTTSKAVVSQISDGQIQATTGVASSSRAVVTQISDGQIQATANGTTIASATPSISTFTGAAATAKAGFFGLAAGAVALAML